MKYYLGIGFSLITLVFNANAWSSSKIKIKYEVTHTGPAIFDVAVTLENTGPSIPTWKMAFKLAHTIETVSNSILQEPSPGDYIFSGTESDPGIPAESTVTFWFTARINSDYFMFPKECTFNREPCWFPTNPVEINTEVNENYAVESGSSEKPTHLELNPDGNRVVGPWERAFLNFLYWYPSL